MNIQRQDLDALSHLRHDVRDVMQEILRKSFEYRTIVFVLGILLTIFAGIVAFSYYGVIKIKNTEINLQETVDEKLNKASAEIDNKTVEVEKK